MLQAPDPDITGVENIWHQSLSSDSTPDLEKFVAGVGEEGHKEMHLEVREPRPSGCVAEQVMIASQRYRRLRCTCRLGSLF